MWLRKLTRWMRIEDVLDPFDVHAEIQQSIEAL